MANLHLVTGFAGQEHVTAADQGAWNAAVMGTGQFVMGKGNQFAASVISNNQIRILDGEIMMQGRYIRLEPNTYVELAIENGTQGYKRNDLVVARYTKTVSSGVEEVNLVVIKGTPSESPVDPEYISGNILEGAEQNDLPLFRVTIDGLTVTGIEKLFDVIGTTLEGLQKEITEGFEAYKEDLDNRLEGHTHYGSTISVSSAVAAALGLGKNNNVDSALNYISQYNMHWWKTFVDTSKWVEISTFSTAQRIPISGSGVSSVYISDTITIDQSSGAITQVNPTKITANIYFGTEAEAIAAGEQLRGKYVDFTDSWNKKAFYYMPTDATFYAHNYGDSRYGCGCRSGTYDITAEYQAGGTTDYLQSTDRNAYPDSGVVGGTEYTYLGIPFANAVTTPKIETGHYTGTNQNWANNKVKTVIKFSFPIKFLYIFGVTNYGNATATTFKAPQWGIFNIEAARTCINNGADYVSDYGFDTSRNSGIVSIYLNGNDVELGCTNSNNQFNGAYEYFYWGIG